MAGDKKHECPPIVPGARALALRKDRKGWSIYLWNNGAWTLKWGPIADQHRMEEAWKVLSARDVWPAELSIDPVLPKAMDPTPEAK